MTKLIPLTRGKFAVVDDSDFEEINQWKWCFVPSREGTGYAFRSKGKGGTWESFLMHRVIMKPPKSMMIDHINHDGIDNRRENLRIVTNSQNQSNVGLISTNTTGFRGVRFHKNGWEASLKFNTTFIYLGRFKSAEDAARAYDSKILELHGELAFTNFPKK